jgi:CARDB
MLAALITAVLLAPAPDLTVDAVSAPNVASSPGMLRAPTSVANDGGRRSARSHTRYWLSSDAQRGRDIRLRAVRVPRIAAGAIWRTKAELHVPAFTKTADYHVIACADSGRDVSERREGNNCRVSPDTVSVVRRTQPQVPPGPR